LSKVEHTGDLQPLSGSMHNTCLGNVNGQVVLFHATLKCVIKSCC